MIKYSYSYNGKDYEIEIENRGNDFYFIIVNGVICSNFYAKDVLVEDNKQSLKNIDSRVERGIDRLEAELSIGLKPVISHIPPSIFAM